MAAFVHHYLSTNKIGILRSSLSWFGIDMWKKLYEGNFDEEFLYAARLYKLNSDEEIRKAVKLGEFEMAIKRAYRTPPEGPTWLYEIQR